jgi:hypothetical protein
MVFQLLVGGTSVEVPSNCLFGVHGPVRLRCCLVYTYDFGLFLNTDPQQEPNDGTDNVLRSCRLSTLGTEDNHENLNKIFLRGLHDSEQSC